MDKCIHCLEKVQYCKKSCKTCYHRLYSKKQRDSVDFQPEQKCIVQDCENKKYAKGYCSSHNYHMKQIRVSEKSCSIPDCLGTHYAKGYCVKHYRTSVSQNEVLGTRFAQNKYKARKSNHEWTITLEEYKELLSNPCFYCAGELNKTGKGLDRIDNSQGYKLQNVLPCCTDCNYLRGIRLSVDELKQIVMLLKTLRNKEKIWK